MSFQLRPPRLKYKAESKVVLSPHQKNWMWEFFHLPKNPEDERFLFYFEASEIVVNISRNELELTILYFSISVEITILRKEVSPKLKHFFHWRYVLPFGDRLLGFDNHLIEPDRPLHNGSSTNFGFEPNTLQMVLLTFLSGRNKTESPNCH